MCVRGVCACVCVCVRDGVSINGYVGGVVCGCVSGVCVCVCVFMKYHRLPTQRAAVWLPSVSFIRIMQAQICSPSS